ncbi:PilZ domain-containing protein [Sphingomonas sp. MMS24-J45]|uniref:PilZ domain-containing protein n=1 Tax=Sphingomonas sp. MMS24-J45 TaxID=3238806 RepID=UPI00384B0F9A
MIAAEFEPAPKPDRRRSRRAATSINAGLGRDGLDRALCKVTNISLHGARLHTYSPMDKGASIWLTLPRIGQVTATIVWADDFEAGCQFEEPLDDAAFAKLVGANAEFG